eukprot:TRINITY_DN3874_c0_g1_i2.p2 TRINITY_DN3874_c0_g1~~TRINITY_DN3874_c0_g1_i2.p2  ORF type:complete len:101 (-),score=0.84 TRINITY_DN3874_c0_g1_i2:225-527(-)
MVSFWGLGVRSNQTNSQFTLSQSQTNTRGGGYLYWGGFSSALRSHSLILSLHTGVPIVHQAEAQFHTFLTVPSLSLFPCLFHLSTPPAGLSSCQWLPATP